MRCAVCSVRVSECSSSVNPSLSLSLSLSRSHSLLRLSKVVSDSQRRLPHKTDHHITYTPCVSADHDIADGFWNEGRLLLEEIN